MRFKEFPLLMKLFIYLLLGLLSLSVVYPVIWMSFGASKTLKEFSANPFGIPESFELRNFIEAWQLASYGTLYQNSMIITIVSVCGLIVFCSMAGYAFAMLEFKGSTLLFTYFLLGLLIPPQVIVVPNFKIMDTLHLTNTLWAPIFTYFAWVPFAIFFFRAYFRGIPQDLTEAARIDGAHEWTIFFKVIAPLAKPAMVTVGIFYFVWIFNDFLWPLIYLQDNEVRTVTMGLSRFRGQYTNNLTLSFAALSLATWPPIIVYLVFKRHIQQGLIEGALKG